METNNLNSMTTEEKQAVEEAAINYSHYTMSQVGFIQGAEFLSNLRKPSEESIMLAKRIICTMDDWMQFDENDVLENLEEVATEIAKLLQPDVNAELLEAAKYFRDAWNCETSHLTATRFDVDKHDKVISNYEKQQGI